ncbi:MAG: hypothetical protein C0401_11270 [Anaerolinea sp.]|nr:hypothetical protein [Anaerolinea sp.]
MDIYSVLAGSAATAIGLILSNWLFQRGANKTERKKVLREKLEEAYLLLIELIDWIQSQPKFFLRDEKTKSNRKSNC